MRLKRTLIAILTLLLVFIPFSVFAQSSNKEITYVSIGDSLAAGMLSDRGIGAGYFGIITNQLKKNGYNVTAENFGVPGAKSDDVLSFVSDTNKLPEKADIVTITAGANDLVLGLDLEKIANFNPDESKHVFNEASEIAYQIGVKQKEIGEILGGIDIEEIESVLFKNIGSLPPELQNEVDNIETYFENFIEALGDVFLVEDDVEPVSIDGIEDSEIINDYIKKIIDNLNNANEQLVNIIGLISAIQEYLDNEELGQLRISLKSVQKGIEFIRGKMLELDPIIHTLIELANEKAQFEQLFAELGGKIITVGENMAQIIGKVKEKYPDAKIYVMGYYNALPYLSESTQEYTIPLIQGLNDVINGAAAATGATYISTFEKFEGNYESYLPNRADIHPGEAGYVALADAFLEKILTDFPKIIEEIIEVVINEQVEIHPGQLIKIKGTNVQIQLPETLVAGTTLTITASAEEIIKKATNLKQVGEVLHFNFSTDPTGHTFTLTFSYDHDTDDVAVYHYDEDTGKWNKVGGVVDKVKKEITVQVDHFSNYGVFAEVSSGAPVVNDEDPEAPEVPQTEDNDGKAGTGIVIQDQDNKEEAKKSSSTLPNTATNMYNYMVVGAVLIVVGMTLYIITCRRKIVE